MHSLAWDHNAYYHGLLLRQLPADCQRVLDVGCGTGSFAAKLAERVKLVDALDSSPVMIELSRGRTGPNVNCLLADVMHEPLPAEAYDAITSISALHHLPLEAALSRLADALRPGGVLALISLPRPDLPRELPMELAAVAAHQVLGFALATRRRAGRRSRFSPDPVNADMPVLDPQLTAGQVRRRATTVLPGVRVRRLLFWRYLLVWTKPPADGITRRRVW